MIDPTKCEFDDYYHNPIDGSDTYYFTYPKDDYPFSGFLPFEEYGEVVSVCISLDIDCNGERWMMASPTIEEDCGTSDVDWCGLVPGIDYDSTIELKLLKMGEKALEMISKAAQIPNEY